MNISAFLNECENDLRETFSKLEAVERFNTRKILKAFQEKGVSYRHFTPTTGYGYDDIARDTLETIYARVMNAESAIVRPHIASGTHALATCLFGILRPGDAMICAAGAPYDTMRQVIGIEGKAGTGSLKDLGVEYRQAELKADGSIDIPAVLALIDKKVRLVLLQRSRGYEWRKAISIDEIERLCKAVHAASDRAIVMVDNCYGEFTRENEPTSVGADVIAGSLIKNPGGGLAPTGGYIAGGKEMVELVSYRLTCPGIGSEVGSYAADYRPFYQGLFMAPHAVCQALKTANLAARAFEKLGMEVSPKPGEERDDIIQAIRFASERDLTDFVRQIQMASPVDSYAVPEAWDMPGYEDRVIMAAGTFVAGASIELSCDAPIREPYTAYMQGALTYEHGRYAIERALEALA
ncbi:MAG: methionine gamma-lyase family protein [Clostridia bacterium]|nr:methionine gamma-lyase family protein [Clostridia bacterium]